MHTGWQSHSLTKNQRKLFTQPSCNRIACSVGYQTVDGAHRRMLTQIPTRTSTSRNLAGRNTEPIPFAYHHAECHTLCRCPRRRQCATLCENDSSVKHTRPKTFLIYCGLGARGVAIWCGADTTNDERNRVGVRLDGRSGRWVVVEILRCTWTAHEAVQKRSLTCVASHSVRARVWARWQKI